jgi:hypothetical protein
MLTSPPWACDGPADFAAGAEMSEQRDGAFAIAVGALRDARNSISVLAKIYLAVFALLALQFIAVYGVAGVGAQVITVITTLMLLPFWIRVLRYFADGDPDVPLWETGIVLRFFGWMVVIVIGFALLGGLWMVVAFALAGIGSGAGGIITAFAMLAVFVLLIWIGVRFITLYTVLSLGEPRPLGQAYRDSQGRFWPILRVLLASALVIFALSIVYLALAMMSGIVDLNDIGGSISGFALFLGAILDGLFQTVLVAYGSAVAGRLYRLLRGLPPLFVAADRPVA